MSQDVVLAYIKQEKHILQSTLRKLLEKDGYNTSGLAAEVFALRKKKEIGRIAALKEQSWWLFPF